VRLRGQPDGEWMLEVRTVNCLVQDQSGYIEPFPRRHALTGAAGLRALSVLMANANAAGATGARVQSAVRMIDRARTPQAFLARAEEDARRQGAGFRDVWAMPLEIRRAMEMASHEDAERRALEGELAELERHWREAEELAAIADGLEVTPAVEQKLDGLRAARAEWARRQARPPRDG
jgi:hypothetical protein